MIPRTPRRGALLGLSLILTTLALAGCGGSGGGTGGEGGAKKSQTNCDLSGCTITFVRDGTPEVSILGISAKLVGFEGNQATLEVAGQQVTVPVGADQQAEGFTIRVERATDAEVVVRVSR